VGGVSDSNTDYQNINNNKNLAKKIWPNIVVSGQKKGVSERLVDGRTHPRSSTLANTPPFDRTSLMDGP